MAQLLKDNDLKKLSAPTKGNKIYYDTKAKGLGLRITASGAKSFVLNYRVAGRERRMTLGEYGPWTLQRARKRVDNLRPMIDDGVDPLSEAQEKRAAPTVADLCKRFESDHLPRLRAKTATEYRSIIAKYIVPQMKHLKVADVTYSNVDTLHRKISKRAPYRANRCVAVLSKMFSLAIRWKLCGDNPCKGIEKNQEQKRHRYLSSAELTRLAKALTKYEDAQAADIIRLLLLTGARRGEVQGARWDQFDLEAGIWTKPASLTKQKELHRLPLSAPARQLLSELREKAAKDAVYVFPSLRSGGHRVEIKGDWAAICTAAKIKGARIHDLRHTYASVLASAGLSLPVIGALLGHSQPQTTARYAHLFDDPLRAATERAGAIVTGKPSAEIVEINKRA